MRPSCYILNKGYSSFFTCKSNIYINQLINIVIFTYQHIRKNHCSNTSQPSGLHFLMKIFENRLQNFFHGFSCTLKFHPKNLNTLLPRQVIDPVRIDMLKITIEMFTILVLKVASFEPFWVLNVSLKSQTFCITVSPSLTMNTGIANRENYS